MSWLGHLGLMLPSTLQLPTLLLKAFDPFLLCRWHAGIIAATLDTAGMFARLARILARTWA
jgi:hypothetical protein